MPEQSENDDIRIYSSTHPMGSANPVPHTEELMTLLLPIVEQCWQILEDSSENDRQFTAHVTIAMTLATQKFLQQKSQDS